MTPAQLKRIEDRAKAALTYERSSWDEEAQAYVSPSPEAVEEAMTCPLCSGEGYTEGQRYDSKEEFASTVVAYGIGKGLGLAEEWVENGPADTLALVAEVRRLRGMLERGAAPPYRYRCAAGHEQRLLERVREPAPAGEDPLSRQGNLCLLCLATGTPVFLHLVDEQPPRP